MSAFLRSQWMNKVFEFRQYSVHPQHMAAFVELTKQKIHLRTAHSPLLGYWNVEFGALNSVCHMWVYDSLAQRASVRAALASAEQWNREYMDVVKPMWAQQSNSVCLLRHAVDDATLAVDAPSGGQHHYLIEFGEQDPFDEHEDDDGKLHAPPQKAGVTRLASWAVRAGDLEVETVISLSRLKSLDTAVELPEGEHDDIDQFPVQRMIVSPMPFSRFK